MNAQDRILELIEEVSEVEGAAAAAGIACGILVATITALMEAQGLCPEGVILIEGAEDSRDITIHPVKQPVSRTLQ